MFWHQFIQEMSFLGSDSASMSILILNSRGILFITKLKVILACLTLVQSLFLIFHRITQKSISSFFVDLFQNSINSFCNFCQHTVYSIKFVSVRTLLQVCILSNICFSVNLCPEKSLQMFALFQTICRLFSFDKWLSFSLSLSLSLSNHKYIPLN